MPPVCNIDLCPDRAVLRAGRQGAFSCKAHAPSEPTSPAKALFYYCNIPGCAKKSLFGWPGSGRESCLEHAKPFMSKLKPDVQCNERGCEERAAYLQEGKSKDGRCNRHKAGLMIPAAKATSQCNVLGCNEERLYKAESWRAFCCGDHAFTTEGKVPPERICRVKGCDNLSIVMRGEALQYCQLHVLSLCDEKAQTAGEGHTLSRHPGARKTSAEEAEDDLVEEKNPSRRSPEDPSSPPHSLVTPPISSSRELIGRVPAQESVLSDHAMRAWAKARQELQIVLDLSTKQLRRAERRHGKLQDCCRQLEAEVERLKGKRRRWKKKVHGLQQKEMEEVAAIEDVLLEEGQNVAQKKTKEDDVSQAKMKLRREMKRLKRGQHAGHSQDKTRLRKGLKTFIKKRYSSLYGRYDIAAQKLRVERCKQKLKNRKAELAFNDEQRQRLRSVDTVLNGLGGLS